MTGKYKNLNWNASFPSFIQLENAIQDDNDFTLASQYAYSDAFGHLFQFYSATHSGTLGHLTRDVVRLLIFSISFVSFRHPSMATFFSLIGPQVRCGRRCE